MQTTKTPVSILQERMMAQKITPEYELIYDGGGTHDNIFTYQVSCDGCVATGTGRCKKDAKHLAAKNLLEKIALKNNYPQLPSTPSASPVHETESVTSGDSSPNQFHNAVGSLQVLCADNNLETPKYVLVKDEGPPHAKIFTYHCIVSSSLKEEGRAKTKKQAKHEAAEKMLSRLKQVVADSEIIAAPALKIENSAELNENAEKKYAEIMKSNPRKNHLGVKLSEYHVRLKNQFTEEQRKDILIRLNKLLKDNYKNGVPNCEEKVKFITKEIEEALALANVTINTLSLTALDNSQYITTAQINFGPDIMEMATDTSKFRADYAALMRLVDTVVTLIS